ncbi:hypothetical protein DFH09DRAFT_1090713 [Mycena vulgaris]|nr:hypothetical protein DFH09DRAFT_1090713 [Mycena vulgaris]
MLTTTFTLWLASSIVLGDPTIGRQRECATTIDHDDIVVAEVYWHVINKNSTAAGGNIPDSQIATDYSSDACMTQFTAGQMTRARALRSNPSDCVRPDYGRDTNFTINNDL